jgi:hypothetical protein
VAWMHILRVKCESLPQGDFLKKEGESVNIIRESFEQKPTAPVARGSEWHIGNVSKLNDTALSFAMGRTMAVTSPQFDPTNHNFMDEEAQRAPYTLGIFDFDTQVCGILRRPGVSQKASEIAGKLATLLNSSGVPQKYNCTIVVDPIFDPAPFLQQIRSAASVNKFTFFVSRPNPQDVDRLIQQPAERYTEQLNGTKTKIETEGDNLDKELVEDMANATAAKGDDASAVIRAEEGAKLKKIQLRGSALVEPVEEAADSGILLSMLDAATSAYRRVRNLLGNADQ